MTQLDGPFRGGEAVRAGRVTWGVLAGPTTVRLYPDVHVATKTVAGPDDLAGRAREAVLYVRGEQAVVGGFAAAELLGASCGPSRSPIDLVVGRRRIRPRDGLRVRQDVLAEDDVAVLDDGVRVTCAERTAWDLVRELGFVDAVVALDALARVGRFAPSALLDRPTTARGALRVPDVVAAADPRSGSPPETRVRLVLAEHGVPAPIPQVCVHDVEGVFVARVDLGWEAARVAMEYQGDHHRSDRAQWRRDQARLASLAALGWLVLPFTGDDLRRPRSLVRRVSSALQQRTR